MKKIISILALVFFSFGMIFASDCPIEDCPDSLNCNNNGGEGDYMTSELGE